MPLDYTRIVLPNQSRLITVPKLDTQAATLLVMARVGSRYETRRINGVSHFVEHLMFKGTRKRPTTLDLSKELDGIGAEYNAFTGKDYTGYYIKADTRHVALAVDVLSDMLLHSKFAAAEIEREKGVIVEEINMYEDNPIMYVEELLEEMMFGGNQLGWSIAGTRDTVRGLSRSDLAGYRDKYYQGTNITIGLAGKFTDRDVKLIEKKFNFPRSAKTNTFAPIKLTQSQARGTVQFKETEQVQLALGFPAYSYTDPRLNALRLLSVILGGNMSSRLFVTVRERNGLAYYIRSSLSLYQDTGAVVIQAGLDKSRLEQAIKLIMTELRKIAQRGVTADELSRAKEYIAGSTALNLEDSSNVVQWYVQQDVLTDRIVTAPERLASIMKVNASAIQRVARDVFVARRANLALIGPFKDVDPFVRILAK